MNVFEETIHIHKMLEEALEPILQIQDSYSAMLEPIKQIQEMLNNYRIPSQYQLMNEGITQIVNSANEISQEFSIPYKQLTENLLYDLRDAFSAINGLTFPAYDILNALSNGSSFSDDEVFITEDALQTVSEFVDLAPETLESCPETSTKIMSLKEFFLGIFVPILIMLVPMAHTQYLHSLDSLEAEHQQLEETEYQERLIQIENERLETEKQILTYLEQISDSLEGFQESQQLLQESVDVLQQSLTESPSSEDSENEAVDAPDAHSVHE